MWFVKSRSTVQYIVLVYNLRSNEENGQHKARKTRLNFLSEFHNKILKDLAQFFEQWWNFPLLSNSGENTKLKHQQPIGEKIGILKRTAKTYRILLWNSPRKLSRVFCALCMHWYVPCLTQSDSASRLFSNNQGVGNRDAHWGMKNEFYFWFLVTKRYTKLTSIWIFARSCGCRRRSLCFHFRLAAPPRDVLPSASAQGSYRKVVSYKILWMLSSKAI